MLSPGLTISWLEMDLSDLHRTLTAPDFDVEKHASQLIQSGRDLGQYLQELEEAEQQVDQRLQDQVRHSTGIGVRVVIHCACC